MKLSIVIPVYNAEKIIDTLISRVDYEVKSLYENYEIILVEDGSIDNSWSIIKKNCSANKKIKGLKLSRNFGQHNAITAGLQESSGEKVIVMDCDLQHNPKYISQFVKKSNEGFDIVYSKMNKRSFGILKNLSSRLFFMVYNYLIDNKKFKGSDKIGSFSLITRKVVIEYLSFGDYVRHYLMVLRWLGFKSSIININHEPRFSGRSSYTLSELIKHSINGIVFNSDKIIRITLKLGFTISLLSFLASIIIIGMYFVQPFQAGWASIIVIILFSTGLIIGSIGIIGLYIGKNFDQSKNRPIFVIDEKINSQQQ
jgi:polyisoprenyl-phosphate glycosyltransferase